MDTTAGRRPQLQMYTRTEAGPVHWRLLSTNRRDMGHGVDGYPDVEECALGWEEFLHRRHEARLRVARTSATWWSWFLLLGDVVVAKSSRQFQRQIRCHQAVGQFLHMAGQADLCSRLLVPPRNVSLGGVGLARAHVGGHTGAAGVGEPGVALPAQLDPHVLTDSGAW